MDARWDKSPVRARQQGNRANERARTQQPENINGHACSKRRSSSPVKTKSELSWRNEAAPQKIDVSTSHILIRKR